MGRNGIALGWPWSNSGWIERGWRSLHARDDEIVDWERRRKPISGPRGLRPWLRALASARASHQRPNPSMTAEAMTPRPGAANGVVPKNGIGIAFWIAGVPGSADMVKVDVPSTIAAGISRFGIEGRGETEYSP